MEHWDLHFMFVAVVDRQPREGSIAFDHFVGGMFG